MISVEFIDATILDEQLFTFEMEHAPRVGETIFFVFNPHDKQVWSAGDLAHNDALSHKVYLVLKVEHFLQVRSIKHRTHQVTCIVTSPPTPQAPPSTEA